MTKCKGCGAVLQNTDIKAIGYTPKENSEYCQRCFRLMHYDDLQYSMKTGIDPDEVLSRINEIDGIILWVCDIFDFEASMIEGLNKHLIGRDIIMVVTKRDLLPVTVSNEKMAKFIFSRLKDYGITIKGLIVTGKNIDNKDEILKAINIYKKNNIIVMGKANVGKSTLLNALMKDEVLSVSRYPGTTLDFNEMDIDGFHFIDTPGIEVKNSVVMEVEEKYLKSLIPNRPIKPVIFQIRDDQAFIIDGLMMIKFYDAKNSSVVVYMSNEVKVHRTTAQKANELWDKHLGELFKPVTIDKKYRNITVNKQYDKMDIVMDGLGWICISGDVSKIEIRYPEKVNVKFRKAAI